MKRAAIAVCMVWLVAIATTFVLVAVWNSNAEANMAPPPPCCCEFRDAKGQLIEHRWADWYECQFRSGSEQEQETTGTCVEEKFCAQGEQGQR